MKLELREVASAEELEAAMALRVRLFIDEQGVDASEEVDEFDAEATHLVVVADGRVVGTCRLVDAGGGTVRLGRMVVAAPARGAGLGRRLLDAAEAVVRKRGGRGIVLSAQCAVEHFYAGSGYEPRGEIYVEAGIDHIRMEKALA